LTIVDTAYEAVKGTEKFKAFGPMPIKAVVFHNPYYMYFVTTQGSGINSVSDLRGRRVATGGPGSGTDITTRRVLEGYGIDMEKDLKRERLQGPHAIEALKDRKVDAFTWVNPLPTGAILDLAVTPGIKIKFLNNSDHLDKLRQKYGPIYSKGIISKTAYPNLDFEAQAITIFGLLICNEKMDAGLVFNILKILLDHQAEIAEFHKDSSYLVLPNAIVGSPVPFHSGAIKYYQEKGIKVE
jgi:TRAP transporter TAXI family solute receptor